MRKISSEEFKEILEANYLFHFHTTYTDGKSSVREYFKFAHRHNIYTLIFTEHVRKNLFYEFDEFLEDVEEAKSLHPNIEVITGVEAKILPEGKLDIPEEILDEIQLIGFACHSFPDNIELYQKSFEKLFSEKKWEKHIRVWVHPGRFLKRRNFLKSHIGILNGLVKFAEKNGVFIEKNLREQIPSFNVVSFCNKEKIIVGHDAHCVEEIINL